MNFLETDLRKFESADSDCSLASCALRLTLAKSSRQGKVEELTRDYMSSLVSKISCKPITSYELPTKSICSKQSAGGRAKADGRNTSKARILKLQFSCSVCSFQTKDV